MVVVAVLYFKTLSIDLNSQMLQLLMIIGFMTTWVTGQYGLFNEPPRVHSASSIPASAPRLYGANRFYASGRNLLSLSNARRHASSEGHCSYGNCYICFDDDNYLFVDKSQWNREVQVAISGAVMFDRRTGISCDECLQLCAQRNSTAQWTCRSVTYDNRYEDE